MSKARYFRGLAITRNRVMTRQKIWILRQRLATGAGYIPKHDLQVRGNRVFRHGLTSQSKRALSQSSAFRASAH